MLTETRLGRPMDEALADMAADRLKNFEFVMTAVTIQRQVGGSLATLFGMVADTVRNRQQFSKKIKGLTAMGRASSYVLIELPFFVALMLTLLNSEYMRPLWHTSTSHKLILAMFVMIGIGSSSSAKSSTSGTDMIWALIIAGGIVALAFFLLMDVATMPARERAGLDPARGRVRQDQGRHPLERARRRNLRDRALVPMKTGLARAVLRITPRASVESVTNKLHQPACTASSLRRAIWPRRRSSASWASSAARSS